MVTKELVKKAMLAIKRTANYDYFFNKLDSPDWIIPLKEEGFFSAPPEPIREGEYIRFPFWPESRYLARVAKESPKLVLDTIMSIPRSENVRVHEDLLDAALQMPPEMALKLASKVQEWISVPKVHMPVEKITTYLTYLMTNNYLKPSLRLIKEVLSIVPDPRASDPDAVSSKYYFPEPHSRIDVWEYSEVVSKILPTMIDKGGFLSFMLLCELLENAIRHGVRDETSCPYDASYIWRPAIEDHEQNRERDDIRNVLITAIRDAALHIVNSDISAIEKVCDTLTEKRWHVFIRLELFLLRNYAGHARERVVERLMAKDLYDDECVMHEYALLAHECFSVLSMDEQRIYLGWIEAEPSESEEYRKYLADRMGREITDEEFSKHKKYAQSKKLAPIAESLPPEWRKRFENIILELGEPEHPTFPVYSSGVIAGPTSPISSQEFDAMSADEIVQFLSTWRPGIGFMEPTPEGLGRSFSDAVKNNPKKFDPVVPILKQLDATYIRSYIMAITDAISAETDVTWDAVLDLCAWVCIHPSEAGTVHGNLDRDPDFRWAKKSVAKLLSSGMVSKGTKIPYSNREFIWKMIENLTNNPDPTPADEEKFGGGNMDPATYSINTTRGEAMHGVINYARWVHQNEKAITGAEPTFSSMEEVSEVLQRHLDPSLEPSSAVRAVYGQWFATLAAIDHKWVKSNIQSIFPPEEENIQLHNAAWNTYLFFSNPNKRTFALLSDEYRRAIHCLGMEETNNKLLGDPEEKLANHLMLLFAWGEIDLSKGSLVDEFFEKASDKLRAAAISFVGRSLQEKHDLPKEIIDRFIILWEARLNYYKNNGDNKKTRCAELESFGWWFVSNNLDNEWLLSQLHDVLVYSVSVKPDHLVVRKMKSLADKYPVECIDILITIMDNALDDWALHRVRKEAKAVISKVISSENLVAKGKAISLIHKLGARGQLEYRDLLPTR